MSISITFFIAQLADSQLAGLGDLAATIISLVVFTPFIEEFSKIFPLYYRHGETQRSILNLAIMVGLGFAIIEMLEYVFLLGAPAYARLPGLFFHPSTTTISAYGIATKRPLPFYLLAVAFHAGANFLGIIGPFPFSIQVLVIGLAVFLAYTFYGRTKEKAIPWTQ